MNIIKEKGFSTKSLTDILLGISTTKTIIAGNGVDLTRKERGEGYCPGDLMNIIHIARISNL